MKFDKQNSRRILVFNYKFSTVKVRRAWSNSHRFASDLTGWPINATNQDIELLYDFYNT